MGYIIHFLILLKEKPIYTRSEEIFK